MGDSTLADQMERIMHTSSDDDVTCTSNEFLERVLLGLEEVDNSNDNHESALSTTHVEAVSAHEPTPIFNPLAPSNDRWALVASAGVLALSAVSLTMYMSGSLTIAAASAGSILSSQSTVSSASEKFNYFFRGGSVDYATGRISCALLSLQKQLGVERVTTYLSKRAVPSAFRVLKKMAIMEVWRRVWLVAFYQISRGTKSVSRGTVRMYQRYTPFWIRRGLQSMFKSSVQKAVHGSIGTWAGIVATSTTDFVSGMLSTQFESAVNEVAEEAIDTVLDAAADAVVSDVAADTCRNIVETAIDRVSDAIEKP